MRRLTRIRGRSPEQLTQREPVTRSLLPEERELLRRATSVISAAPSAASPSMPDTFFACACEGPATHKPTAFSRRNVA